MTADSPKHAPASPMRIILALVLMGMLPPLLATALDVCGWRPAHTVNHGELIQPPRALPDVTLRTRSGTAISFRAWRERWLLIYFAATGCQPACLDRLDTLQRLRRALGPDARRLQAVLILPPASARWPDPHLDEGVLLLSAAAPVRAQLAAILTTDPQATGGGNRLYLADPLGNLIMSYRPDSPPREIIEDLKRLMTYSWVG
jgi:cytochrome oxidase Cu insertion factor (SCO1/SenC/PrrC family)